MCQFLGLPKDHVVVVSSGSAALFLALWALNAKGKEVAIPSYCCSALANAVELVGGRSLFVDSSVACPNVDPHQIDSFGCSIAIVPHVFGIPVDLSQVKEVYVVEDCAQAIGATVNQQSVGLQGYLGVFSFSATKLLTTGGQGGAIASREKELIDSIRDFREFDFRQDKKPRFNFQITDVQSAIGRVQLKKLPMLLSRRREIFERYKTVVPLMERRNKSSEAVPYRAIIETSEPKKFIEFFRSRGITCINPMQTWELYGNLTEMPNAKRYSESLVSLPIYPHISDQAVDQIIRSLREWDSQVGI